MFDKDLGELLGEVGMEVGGIGYGNCAVRDDDDVADLRVLSAVIIGKDHSGG